MATSPVPAAPLPDTGRAKRPDTPIDQKAQGKDMHGFSDKDSQERQLQYGLDAIKFVVGPMKPQDFVAEFSPPTKNYLDMPSPKDAFKDVDWDTKVESKIYKAFAKALNMGQSRKGAKLQSRCPGFQFVVTAHTGEDGHTLGSAIPDLGMYRKEDLRPLCSKKGEYRSHLGRAEIACEIKTRYHTDYFGDLPKGVSRDAHNFVLNFTSQKALEKAQAHLGQHVHYASDMLARQHRTCCFTVALHGPYARMIRWDRAGAVVTEAFDLRKHPEYLLKFIWNYSEGSEETRGYDTSVRPATKADEEIFKKQITKHIKLQLAIPDGILEEAQQNVLNQAVKEHYERGNVCSIAVLEKGATSADKVHWYLVSKPVVSPLSVASRATRGYWAVSVETHDVAFLKDTWRFNVKQMECEGDIIGRLSDAKVKNIPRLLHHGDVPMVLPGQLTGSSTKHKKVKQGKIEESEVLPPQITRTDQFRDANWSCTQGRLYKVSVVSHIHYRLILGTVGCPLKDLTGTHELLNSTFDVFQAMIDAYNAGMLHRDISLGNILLVRNAAGEARKGCLIDWELAAPVDRGTSPRAYERTGTWQFMSIRLFKDSEFVHSIQDDMESMLYVVLYCALRWLPHNLDPPDLLYCMRRFFDEGERRPNGKMVGGSEKHSNKCFRSTTKDILFACEYLQEWLTTVMQYHGPVGSAEQLAMAAGKWERPDDLHKFWKNFLETKALPQHDRHTNALKGTKAVPLDVDTGRLKATTSLSKSQTPSATTPAIAGEPTGPTAPPVSSASQSQAAVGSPAIRQTGYFLRSSIQVSKPSSSQAQTRKARK